MTDRESAAATKSEWESTIRAVYSSDDAFPDQIARIRGSGSLRKYAYASVSVCPFVYRPLAEKLTVYDAVRVTVHFDRPAAGSAPAREVDALMRDRFADEQASRLFVNYESLKEVYDTANPVDHSATESFDYIVVTTDALSSAVSASSFVAWKTSRGYCKPGGRFI
jgi:hypothetical protein